MIKKGGLIELENNQRVVADTTNIQADEKACGSREGGQQEGGPLSPDDEQAVLDHPPAFSDGDSIKQLSIVSHIFVLMESFLLAFFRLKWIS